MFYVNEKQPIRHRRIRAFTGDEVGIGVILGAVEFEWTVRRCIIACGTSPNVVVRRRLDSSEGRGTEGYKKAWRDEVRPRFGMTLVEVVPDWQYLVEHAFPLRHRLVHGVVGTVGQDHAIQRRDALLAASKAVMDFAAERGIHLDERLPVRQVSFSAKKSNDRVRLQ